MKAHWRIALLILFAATVLAQSGADRGGRITQGATSFPGFAQQFGQQAHTGHRYGYGANQGYVIPAAYPVFISGGYAAIPPDGSYYQQQPPANITIVLAPQNAGQPPVVINQGFGGGSATPAIQEYGPGAQQSQQAGPQQQQGRARIVCAATT